MLRWLVSGAGYRGIDMNSEEVLRFWFEEIEPAQHWKKDQEFDQLVRDRFAAGSFGRQQMRVVWLANKCRGAVGRNHCSRSVFAKYVS